MVISLGCIQKGPDDVVLPKQVESSQTPDSFSRGQAYFHQIKHLLVSVCVVGKVELVRSIILKNIGERCALL